MRAAITLRRLERVRTLSCAVSDSRFSDIAGWLGLETVAGYVDLQAVLDQVTALGVDYSQGFFFGKPGPELPDPECPLADRIIAAIQSLLTVDNLP